MLNKNLNACIYILNLVDFTYNVYFGTTFNTNQNKLKHMVILKFNIAQLTN